MFFTPDRGQRGFKFAYRPPVALTGLFLTLGSVHLAAEPSVPPAVPPPADVALAVVYDTSGSMRVPIRAADGGVQPKHVIARRAFDHVIDRLERFTQPSPGTPAGVAKRLDLGITVFASGGGREALPLAPFRAETARAWLRQLPPPDAGTPLGDAIAFAGASLLASPAASKHLLVLTDGENTHGITPAAALANLRKQAPGQEQLLFVHILALDIPPAVFAALQKQGATLIGATDEKQLQSQLDFILETQILVEAP